MDLKHIIARLRPRHIELLDALGADPNLGRCARRLNMGHSTASKALREIEDIFQTPLFTRNRRGLSPTAMGEVLTRRAAILMEEMRGLHHEYESTLAGGTGRIRVGVFPVALPNLFPAWRRQMLADWPRIVVAANEGAEYTLLAELSGGQLDCILGRVVLERLTPDLRHEVLYHEESAIVCGVHHPVANVPVMARLAALAASEWILPSPEGASFNLVASRLAEEGQRAPRVVIEAISAYLTVELLAAENLVSILPVSVAQELAALGKIHIVPVALPASRKPVGILYRRDMAASPLVKSALGAARKVAVGICRTEAVSRPADARQR
ncbi:MAG: LysR family transcriptional regulator [Pigmentiphaga sp.]|nr:LysR family transcriptional regulator [Pigmentiphaga sp.]